MSAVTILSYAAQDDVGEGAAVDVSEFSTLRLDLRLTADHSVVPELDFSIQDAPSANGPWRTIETRKYVGSTVGADAPYGWDTRRRFILAGFDSFVRASWNGAERLKKPVAAQFIFGLAGDGKPDEA